MVLYGLFTWRRAVYCLKVFSLAEPWWPQVPRSLVSLPFLYFSEFFLNVFFICNTQGFCRKNMEKYIYLWREFFALCPLERQTILCFSRDSHVLKGNNFSFGRMAFYERSSGVGGLRGYMSGWYDGGATPGAWECLLVLGKPRLAPRRTRPRLQCGGCCRSTARKCSLGIFLLHLACCQRGKRRKRPSKVNVYFCLPKRPHGLAA